MNVMPQISRRRVLAGAGGGVAAVLASACSAAPSGQPAASGGQKLSGTFEFWQPWPIEQPTHGGPIGWKQLMDGFNGMGDLKVNIISPAGASAIETPLQTAFAGGNPPDAWQASSPSYVKASRGCS